jgi:hypothetical protein
MMGGSAESHLIVVYLFYSPLKNMIGQKISLSALPHDIIKKMCTRHQTFHGKEVYHVGMGAGGQWAAGEGVVDGAHGFHVVKISSGFRCAHFSIGDVVVSGENLPKTLVQSAIHPIVRPAQ